VRRGSTRIHFERAEDRLIVSGQIRRGRVVVRSLPVVGPANYAAAGLRAVLEEHGIEVTGSVRTITDPAESPMRPGAVPPRIVATHLSPTLAEIVSVTNHVSHNLFAEALLRAAGRAAAGAGSVDGGARAVRALLALAPGADTTALHQVDGSGLSTLDHTTPGNTVALLEYLSGTGDRDAYLASLPRAGNEHGLRRMYDSAAAGNLRAKTGTIHGVSALSGYVTTAGGEHLVFSIMANGVPSTAREKDSEDAIGARLAAFSR
jgi:D-alanyl-D-alanine carboxypeptidase/D-alanyl-D-alanine-endopeptidase (penicillin-binding protein 4)